MSCTPNDLLAFARSLPLDKDEASRRSAVSRAYYAAFHAASNAIQHNSDLHSPTSHQDLQAALKLKAHAPSIQNEAKQLCNMLPRLKADRKFADYRLTEALDEDDAKTSLIRAQKCLAAAHDLRRKCPPGAA